MIIRRYLVRVNNYQGPAWDLDLIKGFEWPAICYGRHDPVSGNKLLLQQEFHGFHAPR